MLKSAAVLAAMSFPVLQGCAYAADADYYRIQSERLVVTEVSSGKEVVLERPPLLNPDCGKEKVVGELVNTGVAAWSVVQSGAPSGSAVSSYASALPPGMYMPWSAVAGWKGPREYVFDYTAVNPAGWEVVRSKFLISYYYGGTEKEADGSPRATAGRYITNLTVKAPELDVSWGWHFNVDAKISNPMNIGTVKNPLAFMRLDMVWSLSTMLFSKSGVWTFELDGAGNFKDLYSESKSLTEKIAPVEQPEASVSWN
ncbi:MAG TPA: hypothetical protein PL037_06835 [Elusimicrobiales bacterium]|nr:hypothetical protein [Elusimicrobiales bacterium]